MSQRYRFSGHQTFVFRYGWLEKGVRGVDDSPTIFSDEEVMIRLGVGKNMVESIRHWCFISQLVEADLDPEGKTGRNLRVTDLGQRLLLKDGWDPFLQDDASLWLIHWLLVSNPQIGTTWQILFSLFHRPDFTKQELVDYLLLFAEKESLRVQKNVMARDVDCFLRTYVRGMGGKKAGLAEETFDCPLLELNLIQQTPDGELFRFAIGPKPSLPGAIFGYALCEYFQRVKGDGSSMSIQECMYGSGSPGQAFKLDENSLIEYVEGLEDVTNKAVVLDETAGLKQIFRRRKQKPMDMLKDYYCGVSVR
jgi:hypothetical protein